MLHPTSRRSDMSSSTFDLAIILTRWDPLFSPSVVSVVRQHEDALATSFFIVERPLSGIGGSLARSAWRCFGILGSNLAGRTEHLRHLLQLTVATAMVHRTAARTWRRANRSVVLSLAKNARAYPTGDAPVVRARATPVLRAAIQPVNTLGRWCGGASVVQALDSRGHRLRIT